MFSAMISGNICHEPELKFTQGGTAICKLRVAVRCPKKEPTPFITVEVWGTRGEWVGENIGKGAKIVATGRIYLSEWETKDGDKRSEYRMNADNIEPQGDWKPDASRKAEVSAPDDDEIPF